MDKIFFCAVILVVMVSVCNGEPPRLRQRIARNRLFARQEIDEQDSVDDAGNQGPYPTAQAPYPAAGIRPDRVFNLPTEEDRQVEQNAAVLPVQAYGPPSQQYGPPADEPNKPTEADELSGDEPVDENEFEAVDIQENQVQRVTEGQVINNEGLYYVQLPNGLVQQVAYVPAVPESSQMLAKVKLQPAVVLSNLVTPRSFAYTSQYQSW